MDSFAAAKLECERERCSDRDHRFSNVCFLHALFVVLPSDMPVAQIGSNHLGHTGDTFVAFLSWKIGDPLYRESYSVVITDP